MFDAGRVNEHPVHVADLPARGVDVEPVRSNKSAPATKANISQHVDAQNHACRYLEFPWFSLRLLGIYDQLLLVYWSGLTA